jgi:hypothetical protein
MASAFGFLADLAVNLTGLASTLLPSLVHAVGSFGAWQRLAFNIYSLQQESMPSPSDVCPRSRRRSYARKLPVS